MLQAQEMLPLSDYSDLYDIVVPQDHLLRKLNDLCGNFDFIYEELQCKYCLDNGRSAIDPRMLFKYLMLKVIYTLSDVDVVAHSRYDMSYKWFLGMSPEDSVIDPSTLCKFRTQRLKDTDLLDKLIGKSVKIAMDNGLIKSTDIILDSTHTHSRSNAQAPLEVLRKLGAQARRAVYGFDEKAKEKMPAKYEGSDLKKEMEYVETLISHIEKQPSAALPAVSEKLNLLKETAADVRDHYDVSKDGDARTGHKTKDSSFFGYKTHIAITQERIITAATITSGEKDDGSQMQELIDKSIGNGIEVNTVIGDGAYCSKANLEESESKHISVVSKLNAHVREGISDSRFTFNKDARMYVCPAGHMATKKTVTKDGKTEVYHFDVRKCVCCKQREGCFKYNQMSKTFSVCHRTEEQIRQMKFQETEEFREKYRTRYKIEAKNSDLKNNYGYDRADSYGLIAMTLQGAVTLFACNMKRIVRMIDGKVTR